MERIAFYLGKNGDVFDRRDIQRAFLITTGDSARENEIAYKRFLNDLRVSGAIEQVIWPDVDYLVSLGAEDKAEWLYKRQHRCDWTEAKKAVAAIRERMETNSPIPKS